MRGQPCAEPERSLRIQNLVDAEVELAVAGVAQLDGIHLESVEAEFQLGQELALGCGCGCLSTPWLDRSVVRQHQLKCPWCESKAFAREDPADHCEGERLRRVDHQDALGCLAQFSVGRVGSGSLLPRAAPRSRPLLFHVRLAHELVSCRLWQLACGKAVRRTEALGVSWSNSTVG